MDLPGQLPRPERSRSGLSSIKAAISRFTAHNTSLKIFALLLAVLMWGFVASQKRGETTEFKFTTPVVLKDIPPNMEVVASNIGAVSVLVRVRRALANSINPNQFQVALNLKNQLPGAFDYHITEKDISYNNVVGHQDIEILQISPSRVPLTLEEAIQKNVPIKPQYLGEPAAGVSIKSIKIVPERVLVSGPNSYIQTLTSISTRPLDVDGLKDDVEMRAILDLPSQVRLASTESNFFKAIIAVTSSAQRVLLRDIPVRFSEARYAYKASNNQINAHLEGPKEVVDKLRAKDLYAVLDLSGYGPGDYRGLSPKVALPPGVKVLEQWPIVDLFVLQRRLGK